MPQKEWTIMIYMAGDNNLADEMIRSLMEIAATFGANPNARIALLAQFDSAHPAIQSRRFNFSIQGVQEYPVEDESSATQTSLYNFVKACVKGDPANRQNFPGYDATHYSLVLSGHGDGFLGRTLLLDESPFGVLSVCELREVLQTIKDEITKKRLSVLGIDSCLMNSLEISFELKDVSRLFVASQSNIPNAGWNYQKIGELLSIVTPQTQITPEYVAGNVFTNTISIANRPYAQRGGSSLDLSYSDLTLLRNPHGDLSASIKDLATLFLDMLDFEEDYEEHPETINYYEFPRNLILRILLSAHWRCQRFLEEQTIDLKDFCKCILWEITCTMADIEILQSAFRTATDETDKKESQIATALSGLATACDNVISAIDGNTMTTPIKPGFVKAGVYSGAEAEFSNGVSIFFPWSRLTIAMMQKQYNEFAFYDSDAGEAWYQFVKYFTFLTEREGRSMNAVREKQNPPYFKGIGTFVEYFGRIKNGPNNWTSAEGVFPSDYGPSR